MVTIWSFFWGKVEEVGVLECGNLKIKMATDRHLGTAGNLLR